MLQSLGFYGDDNSRTFLLKVEGRGHSHCPRAREAGGPAALPPASRPKLLEGAAGWSVLEVSLVRWSQTGGEAGMCVSLFG